MLRNPTSSDFSAKSAAQVPRRPQLLVSIRNLAEARLARSLGVDWIDLKDPEAGSLGAASVETASQVAGELWDFPNRSAALGELRECRQLDLSELIKSFPIVKVGLSHALETGDWADQLRELANRIADLGAELVPVIYADYVRCGAPQPHEVLDIAQQMGATYVLIDTYQKDGRGLLHWLDINGLRDLIASAKQWQGQVLLAGSLTLSELPELIELPAAAIAVRGAVCDGDRRGAMSPIKVQHWLKLFRNR